MAEESLSEKYNRLHKEGKTREATRVAQEYSGESSQEEVEEESEVRRDLVYSHEFDGIGEEISEEIYQEYGDWDEFVENVTREGLVEISGIGESRADSILEQVE